MAVQASIMTTQASALAGPDSVLLPANPPRFGPVTKKLILRTTVWAAGILLVGLVLTFAVDSPYARAAGLAVIFPGAGFLYDAWPLLTLATLVLFFVAIILWWGVSAFVAIPAVWGASIAGSVALAEGPRLFTGRDTTWEWAMPLTLAVYAVIAATVVYRIEANYRRKLASMAANNAYLATVTLPDRSRPLVEPTEKDSELLRWAFSLALQPIDQFEGFDWGEQYHGGTCLRYQLNALGGAMAVCAANLLPNYQEVIRPALEDLVYKTTDLRVWKYWALENLVGNFSRNPDPMVKDNIMLSGFFENQINLMEAATGSDRFDQPGSLPFVWKDGRVFEYDHKTIAEAVARNFEGAEIGLFPCEPGWVFTVCNTMGAQGLKGYDVLHGTDYWTRVEPSWRKGVLDEMMTPDGAFRHIRSNVLGLTFNDGDGTGEYFTTGSNQFEDVAPDVARRGRLLALRGVGQRMAGLEKTIVDGRLAIPPMTPARERGTLIKTATPAWMGLVAGARAVGNEAVARAAGQRLEEECSTDEPFPSKPFHGGIQTNAGYLGIRWGTPLSQADLALRGYVPPVGPVLAHAPWPEVLVSKARSGDGLSLDLVVEPNAAAAGVVHELVFDALTPNREYRLSGDGMSAAVTADSEGKGTASVALDRRVAVSLSPA